MNFEGKSVFGGIAIGKISLYHKEEDPVRKYHVTDAAAEIVRFKNAKDEAKEELFTFYEKAFNEVGEANAMIFEAHRIMLDDPEYVEAVTDMILTHKVNAEFAVFTVADNISQMFATMDDEYIKERACDVKDVSNRVIAILNDEQSFYEGEEEAVILLADDLSPTETVQLDKSKLLSFVTRYGSINSHTAILARTMNIPSLVGVNFSKDMEGKMGIVDGYSGILIVDPDEETLKRYTHIKEEDEKRKKLLLELKGKETITKDGKKISLYANIGNVADVEAALKNDADGIGLFRSEFLYLESRDYPTEEEQFMVYKAVVEKMSCKKVIIRTLDIGADKQVEYFNLDYEENPALGYRAIRICLDRKDVFKTQLRAIYRASYYGTIAIMFPMIISLREVHQIKEILAEVKEELNQEGIPYSECEIGIMIETPASVMISDILAKEVDFFSIGTNDLTQYTLAIDRLNPRLDHIYDSHHEAVFRMIQMVINNGHKEGCHVSICGELGADTELTKMFIKMGIDGLSVSPAMILNLRKEIREAGVSE